MGTDPTAAVRRGRRKETKHSHNSRASAAPVTAKINTYDPKDGLPDVDIAIGA